MLTSDGTLLLAHANSKELSQQPGTVRNLGVDIMAEAPLLPLLELDDLVRGEYWLRLAHLVRRRTLGNFKFFLEAGVLHEDLEHETVLLGFRKRIGPFLFNWVLGRQNKEWIGELSPFSTDRHLPLLHCLK